MSFFRLEKRKDFIENLDVNEILVIFFLFLKHLVKEADSFYNYNCSSYFVNIFVVFNETWIWPHLPFPPP